jgi:hypothetical protein
MAKAVNVGASQPEEETVWQPRRHRPAVPTAVIRDRMHPRSRLARTGCPSAKPATVAGPNVRTGSVRPTTSERSAPDRPAAVAAATGQRTCDPATTRFFICLNSSTRLLNVADVPSVSAPKGARISVSASKSARMADLTIVW